MRRPLDTPTEKPRSISSISPMLAQSGNPFAAVVQTLGLQTTPLSIMRLVCHGGWAGEAGEQPCRLLLVARRA